MSLDAKHCIPCEAGVAPFTLTQAQEMVQEVPLWSLDQEAHTLTRTFSFNDFAHAMAFANKIAVLAESEGHHPDLIVKWGSVRVDLSTHAIGGLSENDFILAAKIDQIS